MSKTSKRLVRELARARWQTRPLPKSSRGEIVTREGTSAGLEAPSQRPSVCVRDDLQRFGRYHILKTLGQGGMGEVRLAYDPLLERKVALKTLRPQWRTGDDNRNTRLANIERRLKREARSLAYLDHPHIVEVLDVGVRDELVYVAMQYVGGDTLRTWSEAIQGQPRTWREVTRLMVTVGRALASAHQRGVVHRDFKPENVVVDKDGQPCVIDFGIALDEHDADAALEDAQAASDSVDVAASESASHTRLTMHGHVVGTPAYMAPEQRLGDGGPQVDQFAFCVSFFELIFGQRPFEGTSTTEELARAMKAPKMPEASQAGVPRWLYRILVRGLSFEPECRYASMTELCDALEVGLQRWQRRWWHRGIAGVMVAFAVVLGTTDVVTAEMLMPEDPCPDARHEWQAIWDDARVSEIEAAILGTGLNYAAETWELLRPVIDDRVDAWLEMRDAVCEATRVHESASDSDMDVRMECLKLDKIRQVAMLDAFAEADAKVVEGAIKAFSSLPALRACEDAERLRDEVPWPVEPGRRARVAALRGELATAKAAREAGQYAKADKILRALERPVNEVKFVGLEAELALQLGWLAHLTGGPELAELEFKRAVELGQAIGHRRVVVDSATWLIFVQGYLLNDQTAAWASAELAKSALEGIQETGYLRGNFLNNLAVLLGLSGQLDDSEALFQDAAATLRVDVGERHLAYPFALGNIGWANANLGRQDIAASIVQRVI